MSRNRWLAIAGVVSVPALACGLVIWSAARARTESAAEATADARLAFTERALDGKALAGDEGDVWIGTLSEGLFHEHGGQVDRVAGSLPDPQTLCLFVNREAAYGGTPMGVVEFRGGRETRTLADGYFARAMFVDTSTIRCTAPTSLEFAARTIAAPTPGPSGASTIPSSWVPIDTPRGGRSSAPRRERWPMGMCRR